MVANTATQSPAPQQGSAPPSNSAVNRLTPDEIGMEFVRQYYTLMNEAPEYLYRLYSRESKFVHGGIHGTHQAPVEGQENIKKEIEKLSFKDTYTKIRQVDSYLTLHELLVVLICGDISISKGRPRRFAQTIVLAPQGPLKYYVVNDIFRYIDVFEDQNDVNSAAGEVNNQEPQPAHVAAEEATGHQRPGQSQPPAQALYSQQPEQAEVNNGYLDRASPYAADGAPNAHLPTPLQQQQLVAEQAAAAAEAEKQRAAAAAAAAAAAESAEQASAPPAKEQPGDVNWGSSEPPANFMDNQSAQQNPGMSAVQEEQKQEEAARDTGPKTWASITGSVGASPLKKPPPPAQQTQPAPPVERQATPQQQAPADFAQQQQQQSRPQRGPPSGGFRGGRGGMNAANNMPDQRNGGFDRRAGPRMNAPPQQQNAGFNAPPHMGFGDKGPRPVGPREQGPPQSQYGDEYQIFVGNLPNDISEGELRSRFSEFGNVMEVRINRSGGTPFGFVVFDDSGVVQSLLERTSGPEKFAVFLREQTCKINVEEKKPRGGGMGGGRGGGGRFAPMGKWGGPPPQRNAPPPQAGGGGGPGGQPPGFKGNPGGGGGPPPMNKDKTGNKFNNSSPVGANRGR